MKYHSPQLSQPGRKSEAGFTIIESLLAVLVVVILMVGIAPVLALSVATRVQARRVELSAQASNAYIDGLKRRVIPPPALPTGITANGSLSAAPAPTAATGLYCYEASQGVFAVNGSNCNKFDQLLIQGFRNGNTDSAIAVREGYKVGVRVYRADVFAQGKTPTTRTSGARQQQTFTGGLGDRTAPLTEITTDINGTETTFQTLCTRLGGCS